MVDLQLPLQIKYSYQTNKKNGRKSLLEVVRRRMTEISETAMPLER
ncbi:hypothetical protein ES332_A03G039900v1 [Gossypium tomentosum]|uniref:Uncharacterized protein n=1 Tax=Gossypium tomentosum TaxID=34277 RepID=A0A5D2R205_GOSTO|nr:hypothetical protein ES332_A03G039900v1 [Gossypium tomentosum]